MPPTLYPKSCISASLIADSVYRLNVRGDKWHTWSTSLPIPNVSVVDPIPSDYSNCINAIMCSGKPTLSIISNNAIDCFAVVTGGNKGLTSDAHNFEHYF